jgi:hypothetical protein
MRVGLSFWLAFTEVDGSGPGGIVLVKAVSADDYDATIPG